MKNRKSIPILGIIIGFILGLIFEIKIWSILWVRSSEMVSLPTRPSDGMPLGPGITTIMTATLGGLIGVVINIVREVRSRK